MPAMSRVDPLQAIQASRHTQEERLSAIAALTQAIAEQQDILQKLHESLAALESAAPAPPQANPACGQWSQR